MLIEGLPEDSALARAVRGHSWTTVNYQLANLQDGLAVVERAVFQAQQKGKLPNIRPASRPDDKPDRAKALAKTPEYQRAAATYLASILPPRA